MGKLRPVNDYFMIEVGGTTEGPWAGQPQAEEGIRSGIVVGISEDMPFFGFNTFMFDSSLMNDKLLGDIHQRYRKYVGKKVHWPERSETGAIIKHEGKEYAFLKMSALMAVEGK